MKRKTNRIISWCILILFMTIFASFIFYVTFEQLSYDQIKRYTKDYNCDDMSEDCKELFDSIGISSHYMLGRKYDETGKIITATHEWLMVHTIFGDYEFECTNLKFEKVSDRYDYVVAIGHKVPKHGEE